MQKKGFTLMEILIVVIIIGILFAMYSASYSSTKTNRKNEKAISMFVEFANAAKLFNEMFPRQRLVGVFGDTKVSSDCPGCKDPCYLFQGFGQSNPPTDEEREINEYLYSFGLRANEWDLTNLNNCSTSFNYEGYTFTLCNPYALENEDVNVAQPDDMCSSSERAPGIKFAVMSIPNDSEYGSKYAGKHIWITNGYEIDNDLNYVSDQI